MIKIIIRHNNENNRKHRGKKIINVVKIFMFMIISPMFYYNFHNSASLSLSIFKLLKLYFKFYNNVLCINYENVINNH